MRGLVGVRGDLNEGDLQHEVLDELLDLAGLQHVWVDQHLEHGSCVVVNSPYRRRAQGARFDVKQGVDAVADDERVKEIAVAFAHEQARSLRQTLKGRLCDAQPLTDVVVQAGL